MTRILPSKRVLIGLSTAVIVFLVIRFIDEELLNPTIYGDDIEDFIARSVRPITAIFASMTVGSIVARKGLLMPALVLVAAAWSAALVNTYINRDDYVSTLRVVDLDWPGAAMTILTTIVAVKTGEWIVRNLYQEDSSGA